MPNDNIEKDIVEVTVKGSVRAPGTYYLKRGTSLVEVFIECGGILDNGMLIEDIDMNAPVFENTTVNVPMRYTLKNKAYEKK